MYLSFDEWNVWFHSNDAKLPKWTVAPHRLEDVYTLEDALLVGCMLITLLRHCDRVKIACLAQLVNVIAPILTENVDEGGRAWAQTIFYPFLHASLYGRGTVLTPIVSCPTYSVRRYPEVPYIETVAVVSDDGSEMTVFAVNRSADEVIDFTVDLTSCAKAPAVIEHLTMTHADKRAVNTADDPQNVCPDASGNAAIDGATLTAELAPYSWNVIRIKL